MSRIIACVVLAAAAVVLVAFLPSGATAQSNSCSGWNATCLARCKQGGDAGCANYCASQLASCKQTGCWTEGARFGGAKHCNLRKG